ncbi:hypothetical protein LOZ80_11920 [Paenibacillus sp. HWE-109]|uniref:hypothetical protein n=1 Tax=Paenibacillus sp. HWE-109 TaxID=1306526 RepID=UPI001EDDF4E3|nr:hypothetical protein [Paenibacillus sp. HWE-109]UKS29593.1 hypothetical protein LOZ80_11920 [Paenibacillus sp. HWE-109]
MEESKRKAYLALNYQALLDIKNSGEFNASNYNRVFRIAHAFHNLALSITEDFEGFNEENFWSSVNGLEKEFGLIHYRELFENIVNQAEF